MAATAAKTDALSKWSHQREQVIDLPSGAGKGVVQAVDLTEWVALGRIVNPLAVVAMKAEGGELNRGEMSPEEVAEWFELVCFVVAGALKEFRPKRANVVKGPLDPEWVQDNMPPIDRDRIFTAATHIITADVMQGVMSVLGLSSFRGGEPGTESPNGGPGDGKGTE
jgi:hypothetical protein